MGEKNKASIESSEMDSCLYNCESHYAVIPSYQGIHLESGITDRWNMQLLRLLMLLAGPLTLSQWSIVCVNCKLRVLARGSSTSFMDIQPIENYHSRTKINFF